MCDEDNSCAVTDLLFKGAGTFRGSEGSLRTRCTVSGVHAVMCFLNCGTGVGGDSFSSFLRVASLLGSVCRYHGVGRHKGARGR